MANVYPYITEKCSPAVVTYIKVMTEYGLITESSVGEDVDGFYKKLTESIIGLTLFEDYHGIEKKWSPIHRKKFKVFLNHGDSLQKRILSEVKPRGYASKQVSVDPPNRLQKIVWHCRDMVRNSKEHFKFDIKCKEPELETMLD